MIKKYIKLNNNREIPTVGLGTYMLNNENMLEHCIRSALDAGYRHIDTALLYNNEKHLGNVLQKIFKEGKIKREDLFITSKLWNSFHKVPEVGLKKTLEDLQLEYLDLYLIHWPVTFKANESGEAYYNDKEVIVENYDCLELWKKMESFVDKGLVKSIGISNHEVDNINKILENCKIKPVVNQIEIHPYLNQNELVNYCQSRGIQVVSYSPLGTTQPQQVNVRDDPVLKRIASKYEKSVSQVILSWLVMKDIVVIPKSSSSKHIQENIDLFEIEKFDFEKIENLNKNIRYNATATWCKGVFK